MINRHEEGEEEENEHERVIPQRPSPKLIRIPSAMTLPLTEELSSTPISDNEVTVSGPVSIPKTPSIQEPPEQVEIYTEQIRTLEVRLRATEAKSALQTRIEEDLVKTQEFLEMEVDVTKSILNDVTAEKEKAEHLATELVAVLSALEEEKRRLEKGLANLEGKNQAFEEKQAAMEQAMRKIASTKTETDGEWARQLQEATLQLERVTGDLEQVL